jgi:DNA-binding beta-propeller fold protein YncE
VELDAGNSRHSRERRPGEDNSMKIPSRNLRARGALLAIGLVAALAGWIIVQDGVLDGARDGVPAEAVRTGSEAGLRRPTGQAQLISIQPLPEMTGEMCEIAPASAARSFTEVLQEQEAAARAEARGESMPTAGSQAEVNVRKPVRMIKDNFASFSSVAVDITNDEVVMTDESLFNIVAYNRTENTPPTAAMSEPKRMIGGLETSVEFQCGLYIDPINGDIYAVNNDTVDKLVIFSRKAKGNVPPDRIINTPHTTYGIAVDEGHQELFLTVQEAAAVSVYTKTAKLDDSPLRLLQGPKTQLADPHGIAVDGSRNLLFVTNFGNAAEHDKSAREGDGGFGASSKANWPMERESAVPGSGKFTGASITIYPRDANGDLAPIRILKGPRTQLNWPTGLAVDPDRGELYVANDTGDSILVFSETAEGDAAPIRTIKGPKSMIKSPTGVFYDYKHRELWVSNFGNHTATVFAADASGDVAPLRMIRSAPLDVATPNIGNAYAPAYDSKRDQILVPD